MLTVPLVAWRVRPCRFCARPAGQRCRTATGAVTASHEVRLAEFAGWQARQREVDDLDRKWRAVLTEMDTLALVLETAEAAREDALQDAAGWARLLDQEKTAHAETRTVAAQQIANLRAEKADLIRQGDDWTQALNEANLRITTLGVRITELLGDLQDEQQAIAEHMASEHPKPTTLFGAGGGNVDRTKDDIDIDRWYGGPGDIDKAVARIKANAANGILTWVSFKLPFTWDRMAAGAGDTWGANIYAKLRALDTPVWIAFHHEPENDQPDEKEWTKFQLRFARMLGDGGTDGTGKVKYTLIFTGWHQIKGTDPALKFDAMYPVGAPIYLLAIDYPYLPYGYRWTKTTPNTKTTEMDTGYSTGREYVIALKAAGEKYGVKVGIAECGWSDEAFVEYPDWLNLFLRECVDADLAAVVYYDTLVNSSKSWWLGSATSPKRAHFYAATAAVRR